MERTYVSQFEDRIDLDQDVRLVFDERSKGSVLLFAGGSEETIRLSFEAKAGCDVKVFVQNTFEHDVKIVLEAEAKHDARLKLGLLDLQDAACTLEFEGELTEQGADIDFYSAQLCLAGRKKKGVLNLTSRVPHTFGNMHNFAVCFDGGLYDTAAAGRIVKGAFASESHQETRVLTMGKDHQATAVPILYIDENDVKASHALTIGQPDADQLYYLQSRGLSTKQAVGLLSIGYFKPVLSLIDDEAVRNELEEQMEQRVGLYEY